MPDNRPEQDPAPNLLLPDEIPGGHAGHVFVEDEFVEDIAPDEAAGLPIELGPILDLGEVQVAEIPRPYLLDERPEPEYHIYENIGVEQLATRLRENRPQFINYEMEQLPQRALYETRQAARMFNHMWNNREIREHLVRPGRHDAIRDAYRQWEAADLGVNEQVFAVGAFQEAIRRSRGYTEPASADPTVAGPQLPTAEDLANPQWLVDHADYVPKGWNRKRLGEIIRTRLEVRADGNVHDATYWLRSFEMPAEKDGEPLYDHSNEAGLVLALLFGQDPAKLPSKPARLARLFHSEKLQKLYTDIYAARQETESGDMDAIIAGIRGADAVIIELKATIATMKKFGLVLPKEAQAATLGRLNQLSQRREAFVNDAQRWLQGNATTPRELLVSAWKNRDAAIAFGAEDNPRAIKAWADANTTKAEYFEMARQGVAPKNLSPDDLATYDKYIQELARCYDTETVLAGIARHKEIFNPEALLPAFVKEFEDGWRAEILDKDDPRGYTIGDDTGCCMRIGTSGATQAKSCVEAGYADSRYSFFVVFDEDGRIAGQSLLYVNPDEAPDVLVIDNIEVNKGRSRDEVLDRYRQFFDQYTDKAEGGLPRDIRRVHLGVNTGILHPESYSVPMKGVRPIATPLEGTYSDAAVQRLFIDKERRLDGIKLYPLSAADLPLIHILEAEIYGTPTSTLGRDDIDAVGEPDTYSYLISSEGEKGPTGYVVAYMDDRATFVPEAGYGKKVLYIDDLAIKPQYQDRGFGRQVMNELLRHAADRDVPVVFHARNSTSWEILKSREQELRGMGLAMTVIGEDPDYYEEGKGAHLVMLSPARAVPTELADENEPVLARA